MRELSEKNGYGSRDDKGYWHPPQGADISPFFHKPFKITAVLKYLFGWGGYLWPWHAFYAILAFVVYYYLLPVRVFDNPLAFQSILYILVRNQCLLWIVTGTLHLILYVWKLNGTDRKFNIKWMEKGKKKYLFSNQVLDNIFWASVSGGIIWTAYEVFYYWMISAGKVNTITFSDSPVWFIALFLLLPFYRDTHFYLIHRLIHWKPLLRAVHSVHHKNPNPGPWSGMSMHPVEHLLYFSGTLIFLVIPSHPVHFLFIILANALAPAIGHIAFDSPLFRKMLPGGDYFHFLHHRFVSCNYGTPTAPWDKVFGSFYTGKGTYKEFKAQRDR